MSPAEIARITQAAVERGRRERREQGIPEKVQGDALASAIAALLRGDR